MTVHHMLDNRLVPKQSMVQRRDLSCMTERSDCTFELLDQEKLRRNFNLQPLMLTKMLILIRSVIFTYLT